MSPSLISWRVGEGAVPGYLDVAVASMRLCESAAFEAPEDVQLRRPTGPSYDGQTPLRKVPIGQLSPRLSDLLQANEDDEPLDSEGVAEPFLIPEDWMLQGETTTWSELNLVEDGRFTLALLAATEAVDLCLLEEDGQLHFLELERAHGNVRGRDGSREGVLSQAKDVD
ncbi:unnamed protein product [Effrenium voratum]|nr:unnamed protein product [Effrenium voratum]